MDATQALPAIGGSALISALLIQYLKNSGWATWFTRETNRANLFLSILVSGAASVGIHFTYTAATDSLVIIGLAAFFKHGVWEWAGQWVTQHAAYKGFIVPSETLGEIRAMLGRVLTPPAISEGDAKVHPTGVIIP